MCYSRWSSLTEHGHHAAHLTFPKYVMSVVSYNAECLVCNYCTSNSSHRWANQGMECWAGANPAVPALPHRLFLVSGSHAPKSNTVGTIRRLLHLSLRSARSHLSTVQNENPTGWIQHTWFNAQLCFSKSSGINLSHLNRCKSMPSIGTASALFLSAQAASHSLPFVLTTSISVLSD